eukprot:4855194-Prymnesium_polylepis.2
MERLPQSLGRPAERGGHPRGVAHQLHLSHPVASGALERRQKDVSEQRSVELRKSEAAMGPKQPNKLAFESRHHLGLHTRLAPGVDPSLFQNEPFPFRPVCASMALDLYIADKLEGKLAGKPVDEDAMTSLSIKSKASAASIQSKRSSAPSAQSSRFDGDEEARLGAKARTPGAQDVPACRRPRRSRSERVRAHTYVARAQTHDGSRVVF